jgi:hypothetical protein
MATLRRNPIINGASGMFGDALVFRYRRGKTIIAKRPRLPKKQSEQQKTNRSKFRQATMWAQIVLEKPERKEYYRKKAKKLNLPNAYTAAITDYMRSPKLTEIKRTEKAATYCVSKKNFAVRKVEITIGKEADAASTRVLKDEYIESMFVISKEELAQGVQIIVTDAANMPWRWSLEGKRLNIE